MKKPILVLIIAAVIVVVAILVFKNTSEKTASSDFNPAVIFIWEVSLINLLNQSAYWGGKIQRRNRN